jgi:hypothetical protein
MQAAGTMFLSAVLKSQLTGAEFYDGVGFMVELV